MIDFLKIKIVNNLLRYTLGHLRIGLIHIKKRVEGSTNHKTNNEVLSIQINLKL